MPTGVSGTNISGTLDSFAWRMALSPCASDRSFRMSRPKPYPRLSIGRAAIAAMSDSVGDHELFDTYFMLSLAALSPGMP